MLARFIFTKNTHSLRRFSSALYITGDKAHTNFAVLTPHIDIVERFDNRKLLEENVRARGKHVDLEGIANRWAFYQNLLEKKIILEATKQEIGKEISRLLKEPDNEPNKEALTKLKAHSNIVKDEVSTLRHFIYGVEESAALKALSLPNVLHPKTPIDKATILIEHLKPPQVIPNEDFPSHILIGNKQDLLEIRDHYVAFLINDAALYEQTIINYFHEKLCHAELVQFSNTDFAKSIIVEGCGSDFLNKNDVITLENGEDHMVNRLHLTGGASHYAFMAHFTKYLVPSNQFPLKFFAIGRKYQPTDKNEEATLFNLVQQSAIEVFSATINETEMNKSLDELVNVVQEVYKGLGGHFRMSFVKASELKNYESLRVAIEMFSNHIGGYIEVGSLSVLDDYLSKRLLFTYTEKKERFFPKVIVGNILNVQKLLGCLIENKWDNQTAKLGDIIDDNLKKYVP